MNPIKDVMKSISTNFIFLGVFSILFALLIIFFPDVLSYTVAVLFIISGITVLYYGFRIKKSMKESQKFWEKYFEEFENESDDEVKVEVE
jgi:uncharacterized membrane protein HdeD (DUF308 family)